MVVVENLGSEVALRNAVDTIDVFRSVWYSN